MKARKSSRVRFLLLFSAVTALGTGVVGIILVPTLASTKIQTLAGSLGLLILWTGIIMLLPSRHWQNRTWASLAYRLGALCMGLLSILLGLAILQDITFFIIKVWGPSSWNHLELGKDLAELSLLGTGGLMIWGWTNTLRGPRTTTYKLPIRRIPAETSPLRIVQVSDWHIHETTPSQQINSVIEQINRLKPDLVIMTGDIVDGPLTELADRAKRLQEIKAAMGIFFVTGNHEYFSGADDWIGFLTTMGIQVLQNQSVILSHQGVSVLLAGINDPVGQKEPVNIVLQRFSTRPGMIRILLSHRPNFAPLAEAAGFDLQFSGHTHGGQFWPWTWFVEATQPYASGLNSRNTLQIITSRGTGYWGPPLRLGSPTEIICVDLIAPTR